MKTLEEAWREALISFALQVRAPALMGHEMAQRDSMNGDDYATASPMPIDGRARAIEVLRGGPGARLPFVLEDYLRAVHANADRGELKALLVEAWGPSPSIAKKTDGTSEAISRQLDEKVAGIIERGASDLRGLAARESQR